MEQITKQQQQQQQQQQVRKLLGPDVAAKLVVSLVFSTLDYCNATLAGLPKSTIAPLQRVQNAAARLVARLGPYDHPQRPALVTHRAANTVQVMCADAPSPHRSSAILSPRVRHCISRRHFTSSSAIHHGSQRYERARTRLKFGERSFSCAGPRAWNSLSSSLQELTDTKTFKRKL